MKPSGTYEMEGGRRCFRPFVPEAPAYEELADMAGRAAKAVTAFDTALSRMPVPGVVGKLFARLDAVHSSGAEGSTTTFTDLLEYQSALRTAPDPGDAATVAACADAFATSDLPGADPVHAVLAIHRRLFERAADPMVASTAGRFKDRPNSVMDGEEPGGMFTYSSAASTAAAMAEWRALTLGTDPRVPDLVRQGMSHWMFEHVHPVPDGNGRIGRLLIPLMLRRSGFTETACAFIGEAVHEDKELYVEALKASRRTGSQVPWLRVFLGLLARTADANLERLDRLAAIRAEWVDRTSGFRRNSVVHRLVPWMLTTPAFAVRDAAEAMGVTYQGMNDILEKLVGAGLLDIQDGARRDRLFEATEVLGLFDRFRPAPASGPSV